MKVLASLALVAGLLAAGLIGYSYHISAPLFGGAPDMNFVPAIAPQSDALTFARTADALLLVTGHDGRSVTGHNLTRRYGSEATANLIELYRLHGYEGLAQVMADPAETIPVEALTTVLDYHYPYIAVGTNYAEHADEVYLDDPPFIFPKLARASSWNSGVTFTPRLDYEAELCMVPLADIDTPVDSVEFGLVLCNDFTDRLTLVRQLKLGEAMGITGFASAKGKPGFLPTGYLFLIPRSTEFYRSIQLELYVDDRQRQQFKAGTMIMKIDEIVSQSFAMAGTPFYRDDEPVDILPEQKIPEGTLILTGTAAGVLFKPLNIWNQGFYLQSGDQVVTRATYLGELRNTIE
jgi:2-keto-4-pentenoate hydratase/2-oxohepta-3-ene-1,7-dioic acid hydratase in catechol pathway